MKPPRLSRVSSLAVAIAALLAAQAVRATDITWDGGSTGNGNWSTATNWVGDSTVPGSADTAIFDAAITNTWGLQGSAILIDSGQNIKEITFSGSAGDYYIGSTGGNSLLVAAGGKIAITSEITGAIATSTETISAPLILQGSTFTLTNSSTDDILQLKGTITGSSGTQTLTLSGSNTKSNLIENAIADGSAPLNVTKTGSGTWYLDGANTFTGQLTVAEGTLLTTAINDSGSTGRLGNSTSSVILGSSGQTGTIENATPSSNASSTKKFTLASGGSGSIKVTSLTAGLTLSGVIDGSGSLIKSGDGALVLTGTNTYAGTTTITLGNLTPGVAESSNPFGTSEAGASIIFNGGTLRYSSANTNDYSYRLTASNNANYRIDTNGQAVTFANGLAVQGTSGLDKFGTNTLTLNGASTYTGLTTVAGGTLQIGVNNAINSGNNVTIKGVTASQTTTLDLNGKELTIGSLTLGGNAGSIDTASTTAQVIGSDSASKLTLTGTTAALTYDATNNPQGATISASLLNLNDDIQTFTIGNSTNANATLDTSISSVIESDGGIIKAGAGTLMLSGENTYTGATSVVVGVLNIQNSAALGTDAAGTTVANGAALELQGGVAVGTEPLTIGGTGISAAGALRSVSGNNSFGGPITLTQSTTSVISYNTGDLLTLSGVIKSDEVDGGARNITIGGSGNTLITGTIDTTFTDSLDAVQAGTLTKSGSGVLTLSGSSTYTGATTISEGVVKLGAAGDSTNSPLGTNAGRTAITSGAVLDLNGVTLSTAEALTINGTGISTGGALTNSSSTSATYTGLLRLGASGSSVVASNGNIVLSNIGILYGSITGYGLKLGGSATACEFDGVFNGGTSSAAGAGTLTKEGSGTWILTGANTYTGTTTINSGGTLQLGSGGTTGQIASTANIVDNGTLTFNRSNALSQTKIISGSGSVIQAGTGTTTLSVANTYTGTTKVNAGVLNVTGSLASGSAVTVGGDGSSGTPTISGTGTINGATTIAATGTGVVGTHSPGDRSGVASLVGTQKFNSTLTYNTGSIFEWQLASSAQNTRGTGYDAVNVTGGTISGSGAVFKVVLGGSSSFSETFWNSNQTWSDIFKTSLDGSGSSISIASTFASGNVQWYAGSTNMTSLTSSEGYFTTSGTNLNWTAVPEPSSALAGLLLCAGLLRRRR